MVIGCPISIVRCNDLLEHPVTPVLFMLFKMIVTKVSSSIRELLHNVVLVDWQNIKYNSIQQQSVAVNVKAKV